MASCKLNNIRNIEIAIFKEMRKDKYGISLSRARHLAKEEAENIFNEEEKRKETNTPEHQDYKESNNIKEVIENYGRVKTKSEALFASYILSETSNNIEIIDMSSGDVNTDKLIHVYSLKDGYVLNMASGKHLTFKNGSKVDVSGKYNIEIMEDIDNEIERFVDFGGSDKLIETADGMIYGSDKSIKLTKNHVKVKDNLYRNPSKMLDLFDELSSIDNSENSEHKKKLRNLLENIVENSDVALNKFKIYINDKAKKNGGIAQIGKNSSTIILDISKNNKDGMSATEAYVHEIVHIAVEYAKKNKSGELSNVIRELNRIYDTASKKITVNDIEKYTTKAEAKNIYDSIFGQKSKNSLSEFISLGTTNEALSKALHDISVDDAKSDIKSDNIFNYIASRIVYIYEGIRNIATSHQRGSELDSRLEWVANRLIQHNNITIEDNGLIAKVQHATKTSTTFVNNKIKKTVIYSGNVAGLALDFIENNTDHDGIVHQTTSFVHNSSKLLNPFVGTDRKLAQLKAISSLSKTLDGDSNYIGLGSLIAPESSFMSLLSMLNKDDEETIAVEKLAIAEQREDQKRQSRIVSVGSVVKKSFKKDNISQKEQKALTHMYIETDAQVLLGKYSEKEIYELATNHKATEDAIEKERKELKRLVKSSQAYNFYISQTLGLGHKLATGITGSSIRNNAYDIATFSGTTRPRDFNFNNDHEKFDILSRIDRLATLEAFKNTDELIKDRAKEVKNIEVMLAMHKTYLANAIKHAKKDKTGVYPSKGEIKDTKSDNVDVVVVRDKSMSENQMKKKGYKKASDSNIKGHSVYISRVASLGSFSKQAMAKINEGKRLHTIIAAYGGTNDTESSAKIRAITSASKKDIERQKNSIVMPRLDGYQMIGKKGKVFNYGISINKYEYEKLSEQNNMAPILLGKMIAEIEEKKSASKQNNKVLALIAKQMKGVKRGDDAYIELGPDAKTKGITEKDFSEELYKNLPFSIKRNIFTRKKGSRYIAIRRDLAKQYVGFRAPSIFNAKLLGTKRTVREHMKRTSIGTKLLYGSQIASEIFGEILSIEKVDIVIRTPKVIKDNIYSNFNWSVALGQDPISVMKGQMDMLAETKLYLDKDKEKQEIDIKLYAYKHKPKEAAELKKRSKVLDQEMKAMFVHDLFKAGLFTSIVEDIRDSDLMAQTKLEKLVEKMTDKKLPDNKMMNFTSDAFGELYMTEKSKLFKMMLMSVQYSDFVARANRYKFLIEVEKIPKKVAMKMVIDEFVNYNRPLPTALEWLSNAGIAWFIHYVIGSNKSLIQKLEDKPLQMILMSQILDAPNPSDASFINVDWSQKFKPQHEVITEGVFDHVLPPSLYEIVGDLY